MRDGTEPIQKFLLDVKHIIDLDDKILKERKKRGNLCALFLERNQRCQVR
jgi:hypothetical protein